MRTKIYFTLWAICAYSFVKSNAQSSNRTLSNLISPTAINQSLLPDTDDTRDIGSKALGWRDLYLTNRLYLKQNLVLHSPGAGNFFIGGNAGNPDLIASFNTAAGQFALGSITTGNSNAANGYSSLYYNTGGKDNTANGYFSLYFNSTGSYNTANGSWALYNNISGNHNVACGYSALWQNQTGNDNTAIGKYAMYSNTKGHSNVALGTMSLFKSVRNTNTIAIGDSALYNFTGDVFSYESYSTAVGSKALFNATTGYENTAIGTRALYNTTKGAVNTAIGVNAMFQNTEGVFNTAIGVSALSGNTTGDYNTGIGYSTLQINKTGNQNTAIGTYAGPNSFDLISNSTSIGYLARATASNQVRLGNADVTSIGGQVGWTTFSDGRYKRNVKENVRGLEFINSLRPVTYNVDTRTLNAYLNKGITQPNEEKANNSNILSGDATDESGRIIYDGFVAQEVEEAAKRLGFVFSGVDKPKTKDGLYGLRYDNFVVPLVKAVQELSSENKKMKKEYEDRIDGLQKQLDELKAITLAGNQNCKLNGVTYTSLTDISIDQNIPNPFTNTTAIHYTLPKKFIPARIVITDMTGKAIKQANVSGVGEGMLNVDASMLSAGAYNYSLLVNGKLIETKQMVIAK